MVRSKFIVLLNCLTQQPEVFSGLEFSKTPLSLGNFSWFERKLSKQQISAFDHLFPHSTFFVIKQAPYNQVDDNIIASFSLAGPHHCKLKHMSIYFLEIELHYNKSSINLFFCFGYVFSLGQRADNSNLSIYDTEHCANSRKEVDQSRTIYYLHIKKMSKKYKCVSLAPPTYLRCPTVSML